MVDISIEPMTPDAAARVAAWAYEPPFDIYDGDPEDTAGLCTLSAEGYGYYSLVVPGGGHDDALVGFCCFGPEARVRGQAEEQGTLDVGGGVRPDLLSRGLATQAFPAVLAFGAARFSPLRFRTAVAAFNERSIRLCLSAGFVATRRFDGPGREFVELVCPIR